MENSFSDILETYKECVEKISSYPSEDGENEYTESSKKFIETLRESKRAIWIGTGRQEEMADFATRLTKASDKDTFCSRDSSIPYKYRPDDVVVALSSSGETRRTIHYAESAYRPIGQSTPVIAITTDPGSTLARIAEKTGGFIVNIPGKSKTDTKEYRERQFSGKHEPLTLGGTLGELYALKFILDSIGSAVSSKPVIEYQRKFWDEIKDFEPDSQQFEKLYEILPEPIDYSSAERKQGFPSKTVIGGLELSGVIARAFSIRLSHCAGENEERFVNFYKDAGNISARKGDLAIIFSGSGQEFWTKTLEPFKGAGGNIAAITSFPKSPLGEMADVCLEVPGRIKSKDRSKLENPPNTPEEALFEIRAFIVMEAFIHILVEKEMISIKAVEEKHPEMT